MKTPGRKFSEFIDPTGRTDVDGRYTFIYNCCLVLIVFALVMMAIA